MAGRFVRWSAGPAWMVALVLGVAAFGAVAVRPNGAAPLAGRPRGGGIEDMPAVARPLPPVTAHPNGRGGAVERGHSVAAHRVAAAGSSALGLNALGLSALGFSAVGGEAEILGRCVAAETRRPLAGVEVFLCRWSMALPGHDAPFAWPAPLTSELDVPDVGWKRDPAEDLLFVPPKRLQRMRGGALPRYKRQPDVVTGPEGRFAIRFRPNDFDWHWDLLVAAYRRCPRRGVHERIAAGAQIDVGDVVLHAGHRLAGRVLDHRCRPLGDVRLTVRGAPTRLWGFDALDQPLRAVSDDDGKFAFAAPLPSGTWHIKASGDHVIATSRSLELLGDRHDMEIVVQRKGASRREPHQRKR
ncbi:MAG: carboxypeptidase-like regulatory domain-containing protein [Planctomycetota bacterium]